MEALLCLNVEGYECDDLTYYFHYFHVKMQVQKLHGMKPNKNEVAVASWFIVMRYQETINNSFSSLESQVHVGFG